MLESKVVRRRVLVDRTLTPRQALDAINRPFVYRIDLTAMPTGKATEVDIELVLLEPRMRHDAADAKLRVRGLVAADPYAIAALNAIEPDFADEHSHFTHWHNPDGRWCFLALERYLGHREVHLSSNDPAFVWHGTWWVAGMRQPL